MAQAPRIDAHMHVWQVSRGDYGWLTPDLKPLYRDFGIDDVRAAWDAAGIDGAVLVQAAPTLAETRYLLSVAKSEPRVKGVVGWIDMLAPDAVHALERLASDAALRGLRPMLQDIPDDDWMLKPELGAIYRAIVDLGLRFDALVLPRHLRNLLRLIERHPDMPIVIDHGAKPHIGENLDSWHKDMAALAAIPHVHCKLSGLVTECRGEVSKADLAPAVAVLLDLFGPQRLMFGSDWPVCTLRSTYAEWWGWANELTASLSAHEKDAVFGRTAQRFYGLT